MKELCKAYIFYKWNPSDTVSDVIDKCIDETDTIHTEVSFRTDGVVLTKTDCEIFDANKHILKLSYEDFVNLMSSNKIEGDLYDWEQGELL